MFPLMWWMYYCLVSISTDSPSSIEVSEGSDSASVKETISTDFELVSTGELFSTLFKSLQINSI